MKRKLFIGILVLALVGYGWYCYPTNEEMTLIGRQNCWSLLFFNESIELAREVKANKASDMMRAAYYSVLDKLYTTYTLPDGIDLGYDGIYELSGNCFAIYDIDKDGEEELIIRWMTTCLAGMSEIVYGFDSASGTVKIELIDWPTQTFYDNGVVEVELSHNQGLASQLPEDVDFWPYFFYQYDANTDTYVIAAEVDAWSKEFREQDFDGNAFPDDIDADGDSVVYVIERGAVKTLLDLEAYMAWRESFIGGAGKVEIPFEKMTGEWQSVTK